MTDCFENYFFNRFALKIVLNKGLSNKANKGIKCFFDAVGFSHQVEIIGLDRRSIQWFIFLNVKLATLKQATYKKINHWMERRSRPDHSRLKS